MWRNNSSLQLLVDVFDVLSIIKYFQSFETTKAICFGIAVFFVFWPQLYLCLNGSTRWCSGLSARFAVGRLGLIPLVDSYQKTSENGIHSFHAWRSDVVENKPAIRLCSWARHLIGHPRFYLKGRWPRHLGNDNSQASAYIPSKKQRYNSLSREWRKYMGKQNLCPNCVWRLRSKFG